MRFSLGMFIGVLLLSNLYSRGDFHIHRSYDLDNNGQKETLILNSRRLSAIWVESLPQGGNDTLWSYSLVNSGTFADGEIVDVNNDDHEDLILIPNLNAEIGDQVWFYLFLGDQNGFSGAPLTIEESLLNLTTIRPSNLSLVPGENSRLVVSFGSPVRQGLVFDIAVSSNTASIKNPQLLSAPIISNGHGVVYVGGFKSNGGHYVALMSSERDKLKTAIFDVGQSFKLLQSKTMMLDDARYLLGSDIQPYESDVSALNGLLIPFGSDDVFLLNVDKENTQLSNTNLSGKGVFPSSAGESPFSILQTREDADIRDAQPNLSSRSEAVTLSPPPAILPDESASLNTVQYDYEKDVTSPPSGQKEAYKDQVNKTENKKDYSALAPTLSDFLETIKDESSTKTDKEEETISVPLMNEDMMSVNWADEAGFTQLELGEYIPDVADTVTTSPIPEKDAGISSFTKEALDAVREKSVIDDTSQIINESSGIDLYYVLAMTPVTENKDRYVFDGEAPFGIAVNQIPSIGTATHLQHGVSADLAGLQSGETYDFAYSLRDARLDSITTLTMVHDMQTNVVFMSISPTDDSLSQSYQPESFDPTLFEFPDYFFEGFPTSLDMDFTDKLIRFSFQGDEDSTYQGIYLSSTTPSNPPQSLAVFMDEGTLQSIRGEVIVRANGSKKVTTEYDLVGAIEPTAMFSRLIQEMFPDELKIKLLQGAYLEEPLFGPSGKLPKVTREPRLPDVQPDQVETSVPVGAKQSNVPETSIDSIMVKSDSSIAAPDTQEDEIPLPVLELEKSSPSDSLDTDTLKLETEKEVKIPTEDNILPSTEESQSNEELLKADTTSINVPDLDSVQTDSLKLNKAKEKKVVSDGVTSDKKSFQLNEEPIKVDTTNTNDNQ